jgi:3-(3-hydroxy-phenyl)propionate hydroxylase
VPGAPALDAPILKRGRPGWLSEELGGDFTLLVFGDARAAVAALAGLAGSLPPVRLLAIGGEGAPLADPKGVAARRYDAREGAAYLLRPDQHVAARWRRLDDALLAAALERALGMGASPRQLAQAGE